MTIQCFAIAIGNEIIPETVSYDGKKCWTRFLEIEGNTDFLNFGMQEAVKRGYRRVTVDVAIQSLYL